MPQKFSSVGSTLHRFIALYLRCRSAPTLIFPFSAVLGKYTPFRYGRYEGTEALESFRVFAVESMEVL